MHKFDHLPHRLWFLAFCDGSSVSYDLSPQMKKWEQTFLLLVRCVTRNVLANDDGNIVRLPLGILSRIDSRAKALSG